MIIKKNYFKKDKRQFDNNDNELSRVEVIKFLLEKYDKDTIFVSTTGKTSRELYELNKIYNRRLFIVLVEWGMQALLLLGLQSIIQVVGLFV